MDVLIDDEKHCLAFIQCTLESIEEYIYREDLRQSLQDSVRIKAAYDHLKQALKRLLMHRHELLSLISIIIIIIVRTMMQ